MILHFNAHFQTNVYMYIQYTYKYVCIVRLEEWEILNGKFCVKDVAYEQTEVMPPCATNNHNDAITNQTQSVSGKNSLGTAVSFIWGSEQ